MVRISTSAFLRGFPRLLFLMLEISLQQTECLQVIVLGHADRPGANPCAQPGLHGLGVDCDGLRRGRDAVQKEGEAAGDLKRLDVAEVHLVHGYDLGHWRNRKSSKALS